MSPLTTVALRPLTLVEEGEEVLVGDPAAGTFVAVPAVGGVVIRALQRGATLAEARRQAEEYAGEPVDVEAFVEALDSLGFLAGGTGGTGGTGDPAPPRTAPIQQRRWRAGVPQHVARRLFGPTAWVAYALAFAGCLACFAVRPDLWPRPWQVGDNGYLVLAALLGSYALTALHEAWHWLAARALGLSVRFGIDRRLWFLVFETDLSQLWTVPRRSRYGPQLAGLAIDSVGLLALLLAGAATHAPLLTALAYFKITTMLWQCMVFLRTDLYGVLVTATGCHDLWNVTADLLRGRQPSNASPRDLSVARWFRWVRVAGVAALAAYAGYFVVPAMLSLFRWTAHGLAPGPAHAGWWLTAADSALLYLPLLAAVALGVLGRARKSPIEDG
jgi:hypothetical protein